MATSPHPVSTACPKCGSVRYKKVDPDWQPAMVNDRVCLDCGTRYSPPAPAIIWLVALVLGVGCMAAGFWFLYRMVFGDDAAYVNPLYSGMMILGGVVGIVAWFHRPRDGGN